MEEDIAQEEIRALLRGRQSEINRILEAFDGLQKNKDWETLRECVFDKSFSLIEKQLKNASLEQAIDLTKIYRLQGKRELARTLMDVPHYIKQLKLELVELNKKLQ